VWLREVKVGRKLGVLSGNRIRQLDLLDELQGHGRQVAVAVDQARSPGLRRRSDEGIHQRQAFRRAAADLERRPRDASSTAITSENSAR